MTRGATQEPGGWKASGVMLGVYIEGKSEEVTPDVCGARGRWRTLPSVKEFVRDLENHVSFKDEGVVGLARGGVRSNWVPPFLRDKGVIGPAPRRAHL